MTVYRTSVFFRNRERRFSVPVWCPGARQPPPAPQGLLREAYFSKGAFEKNPLGKVKPLHTIYFYPVTMFIVVRADSAIHKMDDLAGKRVSLGVPAAGLTVAAVDLFKALGLWDKIQNRWISLTDLPVTPTGETTGPDSRPRP